ncbi:hypothetical protein ESCO_002840 [Escovopsis weberi]|uniref:DUF1993 domain-containing protein n=1 Tax=Escovopsis weberi TaxID=150374 RepID=A0A0M8N1G6_ESCWE|nr:hypothetical protein ESCO_002840 [Escovopsis weberi]
MSFTFYDHCVPITQRALKSLREILLKAQTVPDSAALLAARLDSDMWPLSMQIWVSCDFCTKLAANLEGREHVAEDQEITTWDTAMAQIERALVALDALDRDAVNAKQQDKLKCLLGTGETLQLVATDYTVGWTIPNLIFHVSVAYSILRMRKVPLGKLDYLGQFMLPYHSFYV